MPKAVTAARVRTALEDTSAISLPDTLTDPKLEDTIQDKTAVVLNARGISSLPTDGSLERDLVNNAVLELATIQTLRDLKPDNAEFQKALNAREKSTLSTVQQELVKDTSPVNGPRFGIVGGKT